MVDAYVDVDGGFVDPGNEEYTFDTLMAEATEAQKKIPDTANPVTLQITEVIHSDKNPNGVRIVGTVVEAANPTDERGNSILGRTQAFFYQKRPQGLGATAVANLDAIYVAANGGDHFFDGSDTCWDNLLNVRLPNCIVSYGKPKNPGDSPFARLYLARDI